MKSLPLLLLVLMAAAPLRAGDTRPNLLFLLSDDHSYPYVGCFGTPGMRTPALDKFAAEGVRCHRFFTAAPQCVPSRAALLTGRSPAAARMTRFTSPLPRDEIVFPELLREKAGYFTGVCGRSYHLDGSGGKAGNAVKDLLDRHGLVTFGQRLDFVRQGSDAQVVAQMKEFLDRKPADKPFFLWVNFSDPHHPWNAPAADRPDPATLRLPPAWPDLPGLRDQLADYCAEINRLDRTVGAVLDTLRERGFAENTLVVFAGDNGMALPHGKGSLYDPGCNTPLLARWPGRIKPGGESHALLSGEDLAPTLLAAAGLPAGAKMSGASFLPMLTGEAFTPRKFVFTERGPHGSTPVRVQMTSAGFDLSRAVRSDRYKLIYNCTPWIPYSPVDSMGGPGWKQMADARAAGKLAPHIQAAYFTTPRPVYEFYDLQQDPAELHNLSGQEETAAAERELRLALTEKMILDFDSLPLPELAVGAQATPSRGNRAAAFRRLDRNNDNTLSFEEFRDGREEAEARKWFGLRDANRDGSLDRDEYVPAEPLRQ